MYALVFWMKSKTTSIISTNDLAPEKEEGEETSARYTNKRLYKAKIVKKSDDSEYLNCLRVTSEGEILQKGKNTASKLAMEEKGALKQKRKCTKKDAEKAASSRNEKLLTSKSIFEDDGPDSSNEKDNAVEEEEEDSSSDEDEGKRKIARLEEELEAARKAQASKEKSKKLKGTKVVESAPSTSKVAAVPVSSPINRASTSSSKSAGRPSISPSKNRKATPPLILDERNDDLTLEEHLTLDEQSVPREDPLITCRKPGGGRIQLCTSYDVWIDKSELQSLARWKRRPKEVVRRLLKILVGENNLKNMCARGKAKDREPIPKDILACVEYYVGKKCTVELDTVEFTNTVNYMITALRHSKKK